MYVDDIIKEQRKLKKKTQKLKTQQAQKKGAQQRQGRKQTKGVAGANQNQKRRIAGKQGGQSVRQKQGARGRRRANIAGKQIGQQAQQRQGAKGQRRAIGGKQQGRGGGGGNQNFKKSLTGNKGRFGGAKVTANRLKNKQGSLQKVIFLVAAVTSLTCQLNVKSNHEYKFVAITYNC